MIYINLECLFYIYKVSNRCIRTLRKAPRTSGTFLTIRHYQPKFGLKTQTGFHFIPTPSFLPQQHHQDGRLPKKPHHQQ